MRNLLLVLLLLIAVDGLQAQQYLIRYDMNSLKRNYYRVDNDTSQVRRMDLRKNGRIILSVDNFNPFYWNAKVTSFKNPVDEESGSAGAFNPISFLAQGLGGVMSGIPLLDLPQSRGNGNDANSRFLNTAAAYAQNYQKVQQLSEKYEELQLIKLQLKELKYDNAKTEAQLKGEAREMVRKALGTDSLNLLNTVALGKEYTKELTSALEELKTLNNDLQAGLSTVNADSRIEGKSFKEIASKANNSYSAIARFSSIQEKNPNFLLEQVVEVGNLYREISNASFHFTYAVNAEPDLSHLKLELFPKTANDSKDTIVQYFQLKGKRNLKIRNSVGAAFTYFTANNTNYFIGSDSIISKSGKDLFNPLISTFIHFYSGKVSGFKWGGAFGVGIPLTGEKKEINFLLGLSTAFGQNEPILLSFGLSGAKVNKLTNGYRLGDKTTETNSEKLVTSGYDVGGFVSIGFNLSNLGKK